MAKTGMRRISEIVPVEEQLPPIHKPEEFKNKDIVLVGFEYKEGQLGDYYMLQCQVDGEPEPLLISCGSVPVKNALSKINPEQDLPLLIKFKQSGRMWTLE